MKVNTSLEVSEKVKMRNKSEDQNGFSSKRDLSEFGFKVSDVAVELRESLKENDEVSKLSQVELDVKERVYVKEEVDVENQKLSKQIKLKKKGQDQLVLEEKDHERSILGSSAQVINGEEGGVRDNKSSSESVVPGKIDKVCSENDLSWALAKSFECPSKEEKLISIERQYQIRKGSSIKEMLSLFEIVEASGLPNFQGCRIPLKNSKLKLAVWRSRLHNYSDKVVCEYLEYGFPLDFDRKRKVSDKERRNHKGARNYPLFIDKYLEKETSAHRIVGPFKQNPLSVPLIVSPMNTVPKSSEDERRVIVDLSWPHGASVNDGISKNIYLGELINLHYASVEQVCQMVMRVGKGAHIYKRDLRHAYRQIPVDPRDFRYLGYFWNDDYYFDTVLAMGQRNAAMACSRTTDAIMYMHAQDGFEGTNYLDDLIGVADPSASALAYNALGELLHELGLEENTNKACAPSSCQVVLGILINTVEGTVSVPEEKLSEIVALVEKWQGKSSTNKVNLQSLIGTLQFVTKCVRQSRIFLNRLLETLRDIKKKKVIKLSSSFQKDLRWWSLFIEKFNGVAFIPPAVWSEPDITFSTDSCLKGCGGICGLEFFHAAYPSFILVQDLPIHKLEMLAVLIGVRIWGKNLQGMRLQIYCDNSAAVDVINSSKTKDPFFASCLRELWLEVSTHSFELRAVHLPGEVNRVADWLSRWNIHRKYQDQFHQFISGEMDQYIEINVTHEMFEFSGEL